jgi:hypothetical protein
VTPNVPIRHFDHDGITVADLETVTAFFVELGFEVEGTPMSVEGEFLDTVIGIPDSPDRDRHSVAAGRRNPARAIKVYPAQPPAGVTRRDGQRTGAAKRGVEVDNLQAVIDRLAAVGYSLVGGIGQYHVPGRHLLAAAAFGSHRGARTRWPSTSRR